MDKNKENQLEDFSHIEFDQEAYDKVFEDMAKNRIEIKEPLKFNEFPAGIKKQIQTHAIILLVVIVCFLYFSYTLYKLDNRISFKGILFFVAIILFMVIRIRLIYISAQVNEFITFSGVVIDVEKKGFIETKYYLVKITDGDKILNFKYTGDKKLTKGLPVSIYIDSNAKISNTSDGYLVDYILGVEFTDSTGTKTGEDVLAQDLFKDDGR